ncbi:serine/threonine protein kinase [Nocardiopsis sp. TSRI0078]|uniref:serine/threonine-protein kinase n=1 Tax=unclassified Nocardiopsis TaxID=2649073 RepID=UPI00093C7812|nr:serine/threonine-protein kinase [Nocardiopsis sp. TSRI0078]OKI23549.1 serine/threonine protein kinase [Nocardiopsis sp. TSRI0078]
MNSSEADPGRLLVNRYRLDEVIGAGGMGRVWEGTDTLLDRPVAVKELTTPPNLPAHEVEVLRTRMLREARSAAQLSHPAIITVFDVAEEDGRPWIVMELVRGPSLGDLVRDEGALPVRRAAGIGEQMAAGLSEAHARGIVHRDIKPGNVLIAGNDRAVLTDFGIAHLDGATHLTSTGLLIGSPSYLAPEIAHGHTATPASDMWALGVTLYQAVEGTLPFDRPTPMATLTAIVTQDLPEAANAGPLRPVLEALCEKRPEDRPSVDEVRSLLREVREGAENSSAAAAPTLVGTAPAEEPGGREEAGPAPHTGSAGPEHGPGRAASAPPSAPSRRGGGGASRGRALLVVAAVLVLVLAGATVGVLVSMDRTGGPGAGLVDGSGQQAAVDPGTGGEGEPGPGEEASQTAEPTEPTEPAESSEPTGEDEDGEDDRWDFLVRYEDPSGFSVDVPEDWERERRGDMVFFHNPDGGYLQIDQTDAPNPDAGDDWRSLEPSARGNFNGYEIIGIEDVEADWAQDYVSAADWEFTFESGGMHAINRGFHTEDKGYALFLVADNDDPEANHALLDRISRGFEPAG